MRSANVEATSDRTIGISIERRYASMKDQLPRWLKPANKAIVALQKLGLAIGTMHVLAVPGRKSGELRETPVSPLAVNGHRYVIAGYDTSDWVQNVQAAGWAILRRGRKQERVRMVELPPEERGPVLRAFPEKVPHGTQFFDTLYGVGNDPDKFEALAPHCPVFRIDPVERSSQHK
jgi:deazaflavin-dependent oxidoreductase (nitroreductase family)